MSPLFSRLTCASRRGCRVGAVARLSHCPGGDKEGLERDPRNQEHLAGARGLAMTLCGGSGETGSRGHPTHASPPRVLRAFRAPAAHHGHTRARMRCTRVPECAHTGPGMFPCTRVHTSVPPRIHTCSQVCCTHHHTCSHTLTRATTIHAHTGGHVCPHTCSHMFTLVRTHARVCVHTCINVHSEGGPAWRRKGSHASDVLAASGR